MRLIDADELPLGKFVEPRTEWHKGWNDALDAATLQAPTMDAVEVVRCKDCGDWREFGEFHICEHFSSIDLPGLCKNIIFTTRPDDYCSSGFRIKRSETETEEIR